MADTIDYTVGTSVHELIEGYQGYLQNTLDFTVTNATTVAVCQALKVESGMWVDNVKLRVVTGQGATLTCEVGDGTDPNGWDASSDLETAGATSQGTDATDAYVHGGKYYAADDTIDLTMLTAATLVDTAVVEIKANYTRHEQNNQ